MPPLQDSDDSIYLVLDVDGTQAQAVCAQGAEWTVEVFSLPANSPDSCAHAKLPAQRGHSNES